MDHIYLFLIIIIAVEINLLIIIKVLRKFYNKSFDWRKNKIITNLITEEDLKIKIDKNDLIRNKLYFFDPDLGTTNKENISNSETFYSGNKLIRSKYRIGKLGERFNNLFNKRSKISTYGDSLTFCRYVNDYETWQYFLSKKLKQNVHLASISGGTDIVSCFVLGIPHLPVFSGEIQCKSLGVNVDIFDDDGKSTNGKGELVCKSALPTMPIGFWNDEKKVKYIQSYYSKFKNVWTQGDFANFTNNNGIVIYGRSDATLNPGGIRIGTAEIYRAVETLSEVVESIAIAQEWDNDIRIVLFVKLIKDNELTKELIKLIKDRIRAQTSVRHVPAKVIKILDIPKTKSGKIVELSVRDIINGRAPKNIGALENPECLEEYENIEELKN